MNAWFGTNWGAPYCHATPRVPVPVGEPCIWCDESIESCDSGVVTPYFAGDDNPVTVAYYHVECWGRTLFGSTGHQLRLCPCYGGTYEGEPDSMSRRDAARAAWELARARAPKLES